MSFYHLIFPFCLVFILTCKTEEDEIRFCSIGMGVFGSFTAKLAISKGFKMVSAFTRYSKHTKTVGDILGMPNDDSLSFLVSDMNKFEEIIDKTKPHFCIDATNSSLSSIYTHFVRLINKKINILTLADDAVYPDTKIDWKTQQIYQALDKQAKDNNVVILGGGYSDSVFIPTIQSVSASMETLSKIVLTQRENVEDWGDFSPNAEKYGVGLTEIEFIDKFADKLSSGITHWQKRIVESIGNGINNDILELEMNKQYKTLQLFTRKECVKVTDEQGVYSAILDRIIPFGDCAGMNTTVLGKGCNNIDIMFSVIFASMPNMDNSNDVDIQLYGNPNLNISLKGVSPFIATAASIIHRVPMVLNELKPGFHNVGRLTANKYWRKVDDWINIGNNNQINQDQPETKQDL